MICCTKCNDKKEEQLSKVKEGLKKTESYKRVREEKIDIVNEFFNNISKYLGNNNDFITNKTLVRFNMLFRGFIIKIQMGNNIQSINYSECNRIIYKIYINFTANIR